MDIRTGMRLTLDLSAADAKDLWLEIAEARSSVTVNGAENSRTGFVQLREIQDELVKRGFGHG